MDSKWTVTECLKESKRGLNASFLYVCGLEVDRIYR